MKYTSLCNALDILLDVMAKQGQLSGESKVTMQSGLVVTITVVCEQAPGEQWTPGPHLNPGEGQKCRVVK